MIANIQEIAILTAILGLVIPAIVAALKKAAWWQNEWCPVAAALLGVLISIGLNAGGVYDVQMSMMQAGIVGFFQGLAAVGVRSGIMATAKIANGRDR